MFRLILILAACGFAQAIRTVGSPTVDPSAPDPKLLLVDHWAPDHTKALARFREDSAMAEQILRDAQLQSNIVMGLARRNLQRDTAKAGK